jgi:osmoprotectant transport system ATP-binding protein
VSLGSTAADAKAALADGWTVVVDDARHPVGWLNADRLATVDDATTVTEELLIRGGSLYTVDANAGITAGSLRSALDAALSSPAALGIAVDADGAVLGSVDAVDVLGALAKARTSGEIPI